MVRGRSADTFERHIYAGNAIAIVRSLDQKRVITVRTTGFDPAPTTGGTAPVETIDAVSDSGKGRFERNQIAMQDCPELADAKIVVSGGRALGSAEQFRHIVTPLTDKLRAATGASRTICKWGRLARSVASQL